MSSTDDLSIYATSPVDFYDLLSLSPTATELQIRSAFRKTSLRYHPDKVGATTENVDKFLLVKTALDVLSDPKIRALYDQTREAKQRRQVESEKLDVGRRKMVSELEKRERDAKRPVGIGVMGVKRGRDGKEESPEQKLEREIRRIAGENRRKKEAMLERKERERLEEEERLADENEARERLERSKGLDRLKSQKTTAKFSFSQKASQGEEPAKSEGTQSLNIGPSFEQTILEKLKMAQREKEKKAKLETENVSEDGLNT